MLGSVSLTVSQPEYFGGKLNKGVQFSPAGETPPPPSAPVQSTILPVCSCGCDTASSLDLLLSFDSVSADTLTLLHLLHSFIHSHILNTNTLSRLFLFTTTWLQINTFLNLYWSHLKPLESKPDLSCVFSGSYMLKNVFSEIKKIPNISKVKLNWTWHLKRAAVAEDSKGFRHVHIIS